MDLDTDKDMDMDMDTYGTWIWTPRMDINTGMDMGMKTTIVEVHS
jgi:hypothetical protein